MDHGTHYAAYGPVMSERDKQYRLHGLVEPDGALIDGPRLAKRGRAANNIFALNQVGKHAQSPGKIAFFGGGN